MTGKIRLSHGVGMLKTALNLDEKFYLVSSDQMAELKAALAILGQVITIRETSPEMVSAGVADVVDMSRSMVAQVLGELGPHGDRETSGNPLLTEIQLSMQRLAERIEGWGADRATETEAMPESTSSSVAPLTPA